MRFYLRLLLPLVVLLSATAFLGIKLSDQLTHRWFSRDLESRSKLIATTLEASLSPAIFNNDKKMITNVFNKAVRDERLLAIAYCDSQNQLRYTSSNFPLQIHCSGMNTHESQFRDGLHLSSYPVSYQDQPLGSFVIVHDFSFAVNRSRESQHYIFIFFLLFSGLIAGLTVLIARLSWKGWLSGISELIRGFIKGEAYRTKKYSHDLSPIIQDLREFMEEIETSRGRLPNESNWSAKKLKEILKEEFSGEEILIVSNREPYIHNHKNGTIEVQIPASGLVTALEPVMRACSGTWIAHGSGNADSEVVDKQDHVQVPPEKPAYQIRRIWMSKEEEQGYYYGFANEGLWPLCHIAHTRPVFRDEDWQYYKSINQRFAKAVAEEAQTEDPVILVQDYHFALLPAMIRELIPRATVITFWHIPWPNPEAFGICPWREEILRGLLGSSILGFHTRFHVTNFLDSVDRFLECRIERETSTIVHQGHTSAVKHYPISIEWPDKLLTKLPSTEECRKNIQRRFSLSPNHRIGIGVDRMDYTKGILEKFLAVELLLQEREDLRGNFSFIQIAAPSRSQIIRYRDFAAEVKAKAEEINSKFPNAILLLAEHHQPAGIMEYFRAADLCFVNSLHDGMNLVAKEFIAARDDEEGVLILSLFAGASRELPEALIVNPYDFRQCASAMSIALSMPIKEQRARMRSMRALVRDFNVFRWAGKMLIDANRIRRQNRFEARWAPLELKLSRHAQG